MPSSEYDVAVIGGGSGGYAAARSCAAAGLKTAVLEGGEKVGGLCILRGCMPTKALLYSAEVLHLVQNSVPFGIRACDVSFHIKEIIARKDRLIQEFASYRQSQLESKRFDFIRANAAFVDPHTLELSKGDRIHADHFVIATGSVMAASPMTSLKEVGYITSDEAIFL